MEIRKYSESDAMKLFDMMKAEGTDWECYWGEAGAERYQSALESSSTYVAYEGETLCGYLRFKEDNGFGVYIYDLLVTKHCRGREIGRKLIEQACSDYPEEDAYVMSGADGYYEKLGYCREGSIFKVKRMDQTAGK
jgi:ribosomal protein S18 acetylase RimI-like enzyme